MEGKYFVVLVLVVLDLVFEVKAGNNAYSNDINTCLFDSWPASVLSGKVACLAGSQLCYSVNGANPALYAVCYNNETRIPDFTGHIVVANVASGGGRQDWHNEGGQYAPNPQSTTDEYKCTDQSALYPNFNTNKQQFCSRGHLTPNADFSTADERKLTMINTNIAPQWQLFNGMNWAFLEAAVRKYATNVNRPVYVFTGVGGQAKNGVVDIKLQGTIVAPQYYWKAICDPTAKESIVFVGENSVGVISEDKVAGCNGRSQTKKKGVIYCYSLQGAQAAYTTEGFKLPPFGDNCAPAVKGTFMDALLSTLV